MSVTATAIEIPSIVENMSFPEYLNDPAPEPSITTQILRQMFQTVPKAVWQRTSSLNPTAIVKTKTAFDLGKASHALFVGCGEPIEVIDADSWRTKEAKAKRDQAYADGKTPVLAIEIDRIEAMAKVANEYFGSHDDIGHAFSDDRLIREGSVFWRDDGVICRCRPDLYLPTDNGVMPMVIHYKTTGVVINDSDMARFAAQQCWDIIAAHYEAGIESVTGIRPQQFFAIQETIPPYLCAVYELHDLFIHASKVRRKQCLEIWARCLKKNEWPEHPKRTVVLRIPPYHESAMKEQEEYQEYLLEKRRSEDGK